MYFQAFRDNNYWEGNLISFIKKEQRFHYGKTDFGKFAECYQSKGWVGRKVAALPKAAWSVMVKATLNLALAILIGIPKAIFDDGVYFKAQIFHVCRDLQAAAGRIISIFYDKYGLYWIEESQTQKDFYQMFLSDEDEEVSQSPPQVPNPLNSNESAPLYNNTTVPVLRQPIHNLSPVYLNSNVALAEEKIGPDIKKDYEINLNGVIAGDVTSNLRTVTMNDGNARHVSAEHEVNLNGTDVKGNVKSSLRSVAMVGGNPCNVWAEHEVDLTNIHAKGDISSRLRGVRMVGGGARNVSAEHEVNLNGTDVKGNVKSSLRSVTMVGGNPCNVWAEHEVDLTNTHAKGDISSRLREVKMVGGSAKNVSAKHEVNLNGTNVLECVESKLRSVIMVGGTPLSIVAEGEINLTQTHVRKSVTSKSRCVTMNNSSANLVKASRFIMPPAHFLDTNAKDLANMFVKLEKSSVGLLEVHLSFIENVFPFDGEIILVLNESVIRQDIKIYVKNGKGKKLNVRIEGTGQIGGKIIVNGWCKNTFDISNGIIFKDHALT